MTKGRLEAFSDGVIAIIITIMVLELKIPEATGWADLASLWPKFVSYILSFMYVGIYWNNHHHTFQAVKKGVNGKLLWANLNLLFWLSLLPFATGWMGEHEFSRNPIIFYGFILGMCAASYTIMLDLLKKREGEGSVIAKAVGGDRKGKLSLFIYILGISLAFVHPMLGFLMYAAVAFVWLIPDTRIEKIYTGEDQSEQ
jgi:uncharacterized membrane protein